LPKPYQYLLRPGYGSDKQLLEFNLDRTDTDFEKDLFTALQEIHPTVESTEDLWMNDEVLIRISSDYGDFILSKDTWDFGFIMANDNQPCILKIDEVLMKNNWFEKGITDVEKYRRDK